MHSMIQITMAKMMRWLSMLVARLVFPTYHAYRHPSKNRQFMLSTTGAIQNQNLPIISDYNDLSFDNSVSNTLLDAAPEPQFWGQSLATISRACPCCLHLGDDYGVCLGKRSISLWVRFSDLLPMGAAAGPAAAGLLRSQLDPAYDGAKPKWDNPRLCLGPDAPLMEYLAEYSSKVGDLSDHGNELVDVYENM